MLESILSIIFFGLAAICNAMMDTIQFHWNTFRWKDKVNPQYWNPEISWRNKYIDGDPKKGLKYPFGGLANFLDAWHLFKMTQIFLIVFAIVSFPFSHQICFFDSCWCNQLSWVIIFGGVWNGLFSLFFVKIFVSKK